MVNIRNAAYNVTGKAENEDVRYHFETNSDMLTVLDSNNRIVGNLSDLIMKGIPLNGVDYKTLKLKGLYGITNIKGIDGRISVDVNKMNLLSVTPFGDVNNPKIVVYKLITPDGKIYENVLNNGTEIGWSSGGKELEYTLSGIQRSTGDISKLQTKSRGSLTEAINELHNDMKKYSEKLSEYKDDYDDALGHDHDGRYIKRSGGSINGAITIDNNTPLNAKNARGESLKLFDVSSTDLFSLGNANFGLNLNGNGAFKYNGRSVWTETNHGAGSGLDADKLGGVSHKQIPTLDRVNTFSESIKTDKSIFAKDFQLGGNASISSDGNGRIIVKNGGVNAVTFESNGRMTSMNHILMNARNNEVGFKLALSNEELGKGIGIYRNSGSKYMGIYNWNKEKRLGYFSDVDDRLYLDESISIQGRKLYLQSGQPPVGNAGDIWIK